MCGAVSVFLPVPERFSHPAYDLCAGHMCWWWLAEGACQCRGTKAEGMNMKEKDVFEDAGIDTDEQLKVSLREFNTLVSKRVRR